MLRNNQQTNTRSLSLMLWNIVKSWAADRSVGVREINAKCESILTKPTFQKSSQHRHCLIPEPEKNE